MPTLNWIGKQAVIKHHKDVPYRLLERVPELDCGDTQSGNLIVQGDNLHALKALLPRYAGQIKCIYIDPPYNTGNEGWVYCDNVNSPEIRKWLNTVVGKEGETLDRHDRWLCMMYPRLVLLKEFLRDDGVIFISIDDNEQANLKLLMDEIFGLKNFIANVVWQHSIQGQGYSGKFTLNHNHIICFKKSETFSLGVFQREEHHNKAYSNPDNDPKGLWRTGDVRNGLYRPNLRYEINTPSGKIIEPPANGWRWSKETLMEKIKNGEIIFSKDESRIIKKIYLSEQEGRVPETWWNGNEFGTTRQAKAELKEIFLDGLFDTPKPTSLIERILQISTDKDSIILDSFAGSGTTAHAVLNLNQQDGGNRKFILVEMDKTIAETITAERNKRVIQGYINNKGENIQGLGGGFQYCRLSEQPLFTADGQIRPDVKFNQLAEFVWFKETGTGYTGLADSPLLGIFNNSAIYLLYNGILGDNTENGGNILTPALFKNLPEYNGQKIIYATAFRGGNNWLNREQILFKQTPYDLNN